jgi:hypothetical protein
MKRIRVLALAVGSVLAFAAPTMALDRDHDRDDRYYSDNGWRDRHREHERREWREHEERERRERFYNNRHRDRYYNNNRYYNNRNYSNGYYDSYGYWHPYGY